MRTIIISLYLLAVFIPVANAQSEFQRSLSNKTTILEIKIKDFKTKCKKTDSLTTDFKLCKRLAQEITSKQVTLTKLQTKLKAQESQKLALCPDKKNSSNIISNTTLLTNEFKNWAKTQGNKRAQWLDNNMLIANPSTSMTSTDEPITSNLENTEQSVGLLNLTSEELEAAQIQAEQILNNKPEEHKQIFDKLQKIINDSFFANDPSRALDPAQLIMYETLKQKYGDTASINSSAFSQPDSQMWFQEMLSNVEGTQIA